MTLPAFDYCAVAWDSCGKTDQEYLDKLQRRAAWIIEGYTFSQWQTFSHIWLAYTPVPQGLSRVRASAKKRAFTAWLYLMNLATCAISIHINTRHRDLLQSAAS